MKKNNKFISTVMLASITAGTIYAINKTINILANLKANLADSNSDTYEWRFGKIFYTKQGEGKPILLVHDLTCGSSDLEWSKIKDELSKTNTVYTLDLLGCGRSDKPALTYTNFLYVQLISDFVKNVIGKRTDVVCTGSSAAFIVMSCYNDSTLFDKILMVNPESVITTSQNVTTNKKLTKLLIELPLIGTTIFNICNSRYSYKKLLQEKYFSFETNDSFIQNYYDAAHYGTNTSKYLFASISANYTKINITTAIKSITNSIIIIGGEDESSIDEICNEYQELNPSIEYAIVNDSMHVPQLENPKDFIETLRIYL